MRDDLSLRAAFSKSVNCPKFDELSPFEQDEGNDWTRGIELEQRLNFGFTGIPGLEDLQLWANETSLEPQLQEADGSKRRFKQQSDFMAGLSLQF